MKTPHVVALLFALGVAVVLINQRADSQNPNSRRSTPISTELAYTAITATGATAANTLYTFTQDCALVSFENTTGVEVSALIGASGATGSAQTKKRLPAQSFRVFDLVTNYVRWGGDLQVKVFAPTLPTGGVVELLCNPQ